MAEKKTKKHYGDILREEIIDKKYAVTKIAEKLGISYRTLMDRIDDGDFTLTQIETLQANRFLPADL